MTKITARASQDTPHQIAQVHEKFGAGYDRFWKSGTNSPNFTSLRFSQTSLPCTISASTSIYQLIHTVPAIYFLSCLGDIYLFWKGCRQRSELLKSTNLFTKNIPEGLKDIPRSENTFITWKRLTKWQAGGVKKENPQKESYETSEWWLFTRKKILKPSKENI